MKCKNCQNIYNLSDENDVIVGKWCPKISDSPDIERDRECEHYKPMTNADRIRNMTDEELAEWIHNISHDNEAEEPNVCIYDLDKEEEIVLYDSYGDLLEWLQAEVKEGE